MASSLDDVIDKVELGKMLGVSSRTIERWVEESRIPYLRLPQRGGRSTVRFRVPSIQRWLARKESKPRSNDNEKTEAED